MPRTTAQPRIRTTETSRRAGNHPALQIHRRSSITRIPTHSTAAFGTSTRRISQFDTPNPSISMALPLRDRSPDRNSELYHDSPPGSPQRETLPPEDNLAVPTDLVPDVNVVPGGHPSEPGDEGPGDGDDNDSEPEDDGQGDLARALTTLSSTLRTIRQPSEKEEKIKVRDPDTFDGTNPKKLRDFLIACSLHFRERPKAFSNDEKKIIFMLSYLKGTALAWFETSLLDPTESAHWMWDFKLFVAELETNFGPHDPVGDAETALTNLRMKDTSRIIYYNTEFWRYASEINWNDAALTNRYFEGLPLRLRLKVLENGKPVTLARMRLKAQQSDDIYWQEQAEISRDSRRSGKSADGGKKDTGGSNSNSPSNSNSNSKSSNSKSSNDSRNSSSKSSSSSSSADKLRQSLGDKLGKDGKLTNDERERRKKEGLCMYCGKTGHVASECNKSKTAKARATSTSSPAASEASPDTKN